MKIVHIGPDSPFVQFSAGIFESIAPNCNEYIILSTESKLKNPMGGRYVTTLQPTKFSLLKIPFIVQNADAIIAHSLNIFSMVAFLTAPKHTMKIWSGWGYDYYEVGRNFENYLLGTKTQALVRHLKLGVRNASGWKKLSAAFISIIRKEAVRKTNLFSSPIPDDYEKMRQAFPEFSGCYSQINYGSVNNTFSVGVNVDSGRNILVGNSASITNNHLEAFEILANKNLHGRKVVVPLSYGDAVYRDAVIEEGKKILGQAFHPLVDFMPLKNYVEIVGSCGMVIMNHRRQQALGNIGSALYHGSRVYLDERNPVYDFFKKRNATVYSINCLREDCIPSENLSKEETALNRAVLEDFWGDRAVHGNITLLNNRIFNFQ